MFIKRGSHVEIVDGVDSGCFGVVRDFIAEDVSGEVLVMVEFWRGESGQFLKWFFAVGQIRRRVLRPAEKEEFELAVIAQELGG